MDGSKASISPTRVGAAAGKSMGNCTATGYAARWPRLCARNRGFRRAS